MLNHQEFISMEPGWYRSLQIHPVVIPMERPVNHQEFISIESVGHQVGDGKNMYIDLTLISRVTKGCLAV
jgi:hypothetical protein